MTSSRFDALTKSFSRRSAFQTTGFGLAATALGVTRHQAAAQDATPDPLTDDR